MTKVVDVSTVCFKLISFKKTFKEEKLKEADEFNESDDDDANEREQNTWRKRKWWRLRFLLTAITTLTLTQFWWRVEVIINSDDSSEANEIEVTAVSSNDSSE